MVSFAVGLHVFRRIFNDHQKTPFFVAIGNSIVGFFLWWLEGDGVLKTYLALNIVGGLVMGFEYYISMWLIQRRKNDEELRLDG